MTNMASTEASRMHSLEPSGSRDDVVSYSASMHVSSRSGSRPGTPKGTRRSEEQHTSRTHIPVRANTVNHSLTRRKSEKHKAKNGLSFDPLTAHRTRCFEESKSVMQGHGLVVASSLTSLSRPSTSKSHESSKMSAVPIPAFAIGTALGSPRNAATTTPTPTMTSTSDGAATKSPDTINTMSDERRDKAPVQKTKTSRWKGLGGLFGKKATKSGQAFYQVRTEDSVHDAVSSPGGGRGRARTTSLSRPQRLEPQRSKTAPLDFQFDECPVSEPTNGTGGLLDVEIPDVHLDRYSVMFGSLLDTKKAVNNSQNLLARRQATLDRLKMVNEAIAEHERLEVEALEKIPRMRRGTSPASSPAFSLFPVQSRSASPAPSKLNPSYLMRSNTSPAVISPSRSMFRDNDTAFNDSDAAHAIMLGTTKENLKLITNNLAQRSPLSGVAVESPISLYDSTPLRPHIPEPEWEMVAVAKASTESLPTPPNSTSSPSPDEMNRKYHSKNDSSSTIISVDSKSTLSSSISSPASTQKSTSVPIPIRPLASTISTPPRRRAHTVTAPHSPPDFTTTFPIMLLQNKSQISAEEKAEAEAEAAASISIARQISVSQRQRQLIIPITTSKSVRKASQDRSQLKSALTTAPAFSRTAPPMPGTKRIPSPEPLRRPSTDGMTLKPIAFEGAHPGTQVDPTRRPSTSAGHDTSWPSAPSSSFSMPFSGRPLPSPGPAKKYGSVRAARLALAGRQQNELITGLTEQGKTSPVSVISKGGERLLVKGKTPSTPTLVTAEANKISSLSVSKGTGLVHRRSERAVIERA